MFTSTGPRLVRRRAPHFRARLVPLANHPSSSFHTRSSLYFPAKDSQDKDSLKPESNEYSKSGSDEEAAAVENAAFSPDTTRPEEEQAQARKESGSESANPLNVSPANHDISQPRDPKEGGAEGSPSETGGASGGSRGSTGRGSAPKSGGGKSGGGGAF